MTTAFSSRLFGGSSAARVRLYICARHFNLPEYIHDLLRAAPLRREGKSVVVFTGVRLLLDSLPARSNSGVTVRAA
jgi:hypothetical protein